MRGTSQFKAIASILSLVCMSMVFFVATAKADVRNFTVKNNENFAITVWVDEKEWGCYHHSAAGLPNQRNDIPSGGTVSWEVARSGCNENNGYFRLHVVRKDTGEKLDAPTGQTTQKVCVGFDNGVGMWIDQCANQYPATLDWDGNLNSYVLATLGYEAKPDVKLSAARWINICGSICNIEEMEQNSKQDTRVEELTSRDRAWIESSIESEFDFAGAENTVNVSGGYETETINFLQSQAQTGALFQQTKTIAFTPEQMREFNIGAVWQFVQPVAKGGKIIELKTNIYTCTKTIVEPDYYPTDPKAVSCSGQLAQ